MVSAIGIFFLAVNDACSIQEVALSVSGGIFSGMIVYCFTNYKTLKQNTCGKEIEMILKAIEKVDDIRNEALISLSWGIENDDNILITINDIKNRYIDMCIHDLDILQIMDISVEKEDFIITKSCLNYSEIDALYINIKDTDDVNGIRSLLTLVVEKSKEWHGILYEELTKKNKMLNIYNRF